MVLQLCTIKQAIRKQQYLNHFIQKAFLIFQKFLVSQLLFIKILDTHRNIIGR